VKTLASRGPLRSLALSVGIAALAAGAMSVPWHEDRAAEPPRVMVAARGSGPLRAGAAETVFAVPAGAPIAGFGRRSYDSDGVRDPVGARALVLSTPGCKVALVSADLLLVPVALEEEVLHRVADLALTGVVLAATHTHASPGGYWSHAVAERIGMGPYDARVESAVVEGIAAAIRRAAGALGPVQATLGRGSASDLARNRSDGIVDGRLAVLRLERPDGRPVAEVTVFAAHPTFLGRENTRLSGDWPGRLAAARGHGVRLVLQGAVGDQTHTGAPATAEEYAAALGARIDALGAGPADRSPALAYAAVETLLPRVDPSAVPAVLKPAVRNLAADVLPATARVTALRIGPALFVTVPGEPVAAVAARWRATLPGWADVVSLANGYLGYVETPEQIRAGGGESKLVYYAPDLAVRLGEAMRVASDAVADKR
jgi:hypothetical protein